MESTWTADFLDVSLELELLDDVDGSDLFFSDVGGALDPAYAAGDETLDQSRALTQQLDPVGDRDPSPSKLKHSRTDSEQNADNAHPSPEVHNPQKSTRKLRHQRKKDELHYLRSQVTELEKELESLKNSSTTHTEEQTATPPSETDVTLLWERVAQNQRKERVRAEVENAKLRERLEGQLKLAKSLEKLLRKRPAEDEALGGRHDSKTRPRTATGVEESTIFALLSGRVDTLCERVDSVVNEAGLAVVRRERNEAQVKRDNFGRVCVELVDTRVLPFGVQDVARAVWKTLTSKRIELDNGYYKALDCTDDIVRAEFCVTMRLRRAEALVRMHIFGRRLIQENRVVMVWATFGQTEGAPFGMQRINLSESGWTLVEDTAGDVPGGSIVQSCVRLTPELDDARGPKEHVGVLADLVIGSYGLNMQTLHQAVENCLVQDALLKNDEMLGK